MYFLSACHSSIGINKIHNQDAVLLQHADTSEGTAVLAVVCDGLGGLKRGEMASATLVRSFSDWFQYIYPDIMTKVNMASTLLNSWCQLAAMVNTSVREYGEKNHLELGTTLDALLLAKNHYYILHIGDSRVYLKEERLKQLTKDQTFVQQQIDRGLMTPEQALTDERRSVILQCVGATRYLQPDFLEGELKAGQNFLVCSDGFRHVQKTVELEEELVMPEQADERYMEQQLIRMTDRCRKRGERDDVSSIWVYVTEQTIK